MRSFASRRALVLLPLAWLAVSPPAWCQTSNAQALFNEAGARETAVRRDIDTSAADAPPALLVERARRLVAAYDDMARLFPRSGSSDDALWHGASLAADLYWAYGDEPDRTNALRLFKALVGRYPTSAFVRQVASQTDRLAAAPSRAPLTAASPPDSSAARPPAPPATPAVLGTRAPRAPAATVATLNAIRRDVLPGALRITLDLAGETSFHDESPGGAPGLLIDLPNTRAGEALRHAALTFPDDVVRDIQVVQQPGTKTRVAMTLSEATPHTTYALYNPYRVVVDFVRSIPAPAAPSTNTRGGFSLSRQLGLGVARVVIDPGHGGHDPGAMSQGLSEADLVLDVALRLEKLLLKQRGVEVVMTRRSDVFVPLEERTALANRKGADLFLSIHANASDDDRARGVETYFLNFAPNPAAEAVAARENAASAGTMRQLPNIVKAIALNNKIDESRDFATLVQSSLMSRLRRADKAARDLGVKQAPFVVLIGATMPSVLAEISFLTNPEEAGLLRGGSYRQQIAEALLSGLMGYQRSLKTATQTVASQ